MSESKREHELKYKLGDMLIASEAAAVLSENSGRHISTDYLSRLVAIGKLHPDKRNSRIHFYLYDELRDMIIARESPGRRPKDDKEVSDSAIRVRALRERQREEGNIVSTAEYQREWRRKQKEKKAQVLPL